ncbi:MAG: DUF1801 domain-containing protein [Sphingobacteriia bacterium]|nr:DUF1801 domain-containing protein [Sphingobacteriia bacterium]
MTELKTQPTGNSVSEFISNQPDEQRRTDCEKLNQIFSEVTGYDPVIWGGSIIGYGHYHYKYESGRQGDWFTVGFSPRKQNITIYFMTGIEKLAPSLKSLGKHKTGTSCVYINKLSDIKEAVLRDMIKQTIDSAANH